MAMTERQRVELGMLTYCTCCLGALAMLIVSFIWAIESKKEVEIFKDSVSSFVSNWESDMVFDLTLSSNPTLASSQFYVTEWKSQWPGNKEGCWCEKNSFGLKVSRGLKDRGCNNNETRAGCINIDERGPQDISKWVNCQKVYAVRGSKTSFKQNYLNIESDGTCKLGFKNCGDKNSKSKGLCIPNSFSDCPITDLSSTSTPSYTPLNLLGLTLYMGRPSGKNPVCDLMYVQDVACFIRSHYGRTPGRSKYDLLKGDHDSCIRDPSVTYLSSMGEADFFNINGIDYKRLWDFDVNNNWQYKMAIGRYVQWTPECSDTVESLNQKSQELVDIYGQHKTLFGLYIASFSIAGLVFVSNCFTFFELSKGTHGANIVFKWTFVLRLVGWIMVVPSIIICVAKTSQLYNYFNNISTLNCSDDDTNAILLQVANSIKSKIVKKENVMIALSFVGMLIEAMNCCLYLWIHKMGKQVFDSTPGAELSRANSIWKRMFSQDPNIHQNSRGMTGEPRGAFAVPEGAEARGGPGEQEQLNVQQHAKPFPTKEGGSPRVMLPPGFTDVPPQDNLQGTKPPILV